MEYCSLILWKDFCTGLESNNQLKNSVTANVVFESKSLILAFTNLSVNERLQTMAQEPVESPAPLRPLY